MEERQKNYTIMEGHELPSKSLIYDTEVNPHVELRSMTARDEMQRLSYSTTQFKTLADIIENCLIEKPKIHVYDMALGDYEFLLHKLRVVSYGPDYKMIVTCPFCQHRYETIANLDQIEVIDFDLEKFKQAQEFVLPDAGDTIKIRFQTPRILDTIDLKTKELTRKFKHADTDFRTLVLLKETIAEVNGKIMNPDNIDTYINKLSAKDLYAIINRLDILNKCIGVDDRLVIDCEECGEEFVSRFQYGPEFLGPTTI